MTDDISQIKQGDLLTIEFDFLDDMSGDFRVEGITLLGISLYEIIVHGV